MFRQLFRDERGIGSQIEMVRFIVLAGCALSIVWTSTDDMAAVAADVQTTVRIAAESRPDASVFTGELDSCNAPTCKIIEYTDVGGIQDPSTCCCAPSTDYYSEPEYDSPIDDLYATLRGTLVRELPESPSAPFLGIGRRFAESIKSKQARPAGPVASGSPIEFRMSNRKRTRSEC